MSRTPSYDYGKAQRSSDASRGSNLYPNCRMPTVAVMVIGRVAQRQAAEQIGTLATTRFCETVDELTALVKDGELDAVVADLSDATGASVLPALGAIRRERPSLPLVLYFAPTPAALREVPDLIAVARGLHVALRPHEHLRLVLRPLLTPPRVPSAGETLARHLVPLVPVPFRPFFAVTALKASPQVKLDMAAAWSGMSRRTLERSLNRARLPGVAVTLASCTALHAAWWLDVQGWSAKQVVAEMGFSHESAVTRVLQRYFRCSVKSLRDEGGFQELLYRFESMLLVSPVLPRAS
jgi:AraC-like DNA-binding protein